MGFWICPYWIFWQLSFQHWLLMVILNQGSLVFRRLVGISYAQSSSPYGSHPSLASTCYHGNGGLLWMFSVDIEGWPSIALKPCLGLRDGTWSLGVKNYSDLEWNSAEDEHLKSLWKNQPTWPNELRIPDSVKLFWCSIAKWVHLSGSKGHALFVFYFWEAISIIKIMTFC